MRGPRNIQVVLNPGICIKNDIDITIYFKSGVKR